MPSSHGFDQSIIAIQPFQFWRATIVRLEHNPRKILRATSWFVSGRNPKMLVFLDADAGKVIGPSFPIGERVDTNVYEPETGLVFSATRDGAVHIFHEDSPEKLSAVEVVKTEFGAKTMGLDTKTHNLFVDTSDFDPPAEPTKQQPNPQPRAKPGTFRLLVYGR